MNFILMILLVGHPGAETQTYDFKTMEACKAALAGLPAKIKAINDGDGPRIYTYAAACTPAVNLTPLPAEPAQDDDEPEKVKI